MNGRVYDPWLGRFLSPDPIVQAPNYSQSYNRYSYVFNNPLKYVDPTGYEGGPYGPPSPYAYGEGSASPGMGFFEFNYMPWGSNINNRQTFMNSGFGRLDVMYKLDHQRAVVKELWQKSTLTNYPASVVEQIVGMLQEGFMLNLVEANGNSVLVLSRGELGNTIVGLDGGVRFENSTAGVYFGTAVVGEGMPWMGIAMQELGQSEVLGSNHNPKIVEYLKTTGSWWNSDETAWCSGFVNWAVSKSNIIGTNSARALSWKNWGNSISQASYGSIAILDYNNGRGHVGFVLGQNLNGDIILLGGNQSNMVNLSVFPANEIDGYIYPTGHSSSYFLPIFNIYGITNFNQTR